MTGAPFGMSTLKVTALNVCPTGVRVTLSDGADGTIYLVTSEENAPRVNSYWCVDFRPASAR